MEIKEKKTRPCLQSFHQSEKFSNKYFFPLSIIYLSLNVGQVIETCSAIFHIKP